MRHVLFIVILLLPAVYAFAQPLDREAALRGKLEQLALADSTFLSEVDISVSAIPLNELVRNVAKVNRVSMSVKGDNNTMINCNLSRAKITDLIAFICRGYNMDIDVVGNIVSIHPYTAPAPEEKSPVVTFDRDSLTLSYDLENSPLPDVARKIADVSGINIITPPALSRKRVTGYVVNLPADKAVALLAESNDMEAARESGGVWTFAVRTPERGATAENPVRRREYGQDQLEIDSAGLITIQIRQGNIYDIICGVCDRLGLNYYFISPVSAQTSLFLKNVELDTLLKVLFTGTQYSYYEEDGIYMFGVSKQDGMTSVRVVQLHNRTINRLPEAIPQELKNGANIDVFPDLNSVIVSGEQGQVARIEQFIRSIDKKVPLITIDVIIVDVSNTYTNDVGLGLGVGTSPTQSQGTFSPGANMDFSASAINKILNSLSGFTSMNLGQVGQNFYANLQLLEEAGVIEMQSTPKLSTLNGHEAELKSGQTRYYKEITENWMGSQNPVQTSSYVWKSVNADLTLKIVPYVSGNNEITLNIDIVQTEFLEKENIEAPPGSSTRSFKSEIRVLNEEMVLLGGIEKNNKSRTATGLPGAARVPMLRWLFGKSHDSKTVAKLNVFIKPTVIW